jgi:hypothetical protein
MLTVFRTPERTNPSMAFPATWKGQPLPRASCEVDLRWLAATGTRSARVTVTTSSVSEDGRHLTVETIGGSRYVLDVTSLLDRWEYTPVGQLRRTAIAEHETATGTAPFYAATTTESTGLAVPDIDTLATLDHEVDNAVELAEVVRIVPVTSKIDHTQLRRLDALRQRKGLLKAEAEDVAKQIAAIEGPLIEQMAESGQVDGYPFDDRKATVRTDTWGKRVEDVTDVEYLQAFRDAGGGWADLVQPRVNAQTLRSMLAEWEEEHGELPDSLPEGLRKVLTTSDKYSITFSNGKRTKAKRRVRPLPEATS